MEERLQQWASSLTSTHKIFSHDAPLEPQHFSLLLQDKKLQPCLSYLVRHVRPATEGRLIKLNLKHARIRKNLKEEDEESSSLHEYLKLKSAIVEARSAIAAEATEIQQLNQRREELRQSETEVRRKAVLVRAARQDGEQLAKHYGLWSAQLREIEEDQQQRERKASKVTLAVKKRLHDDLLGLECVHQAILSDRPGGQHSLHQMKEHLWESIGEGVGEWSPRMAVEAVVGETQDGQRALRSHLQGVDLARDAHDLRVKCESDGTFIDETNPSGVVESVQELLRQMSAAHVRLHLQAHQENQAALSLGRVLATNTNNITTVVKRRYEDEEVAAAVLELVKTTLALAGERVALASAQAFTASLQDKADMAARIQAAVRDKHARIVNFEKEIQERIESMQCLATSVEGGRETVKQLVAQLRADVGEALTLTTTPTPASTNLAAECEKLETIPLAHLLTTEMETSERKPKINMSTAPLVWHNPEAAAGGWRAVNQLCEGMRCWDGVYEAATKRLLLTATLHRQMERLTSLREAMDTTRKQSEAISSLDTKELIKQVEANDHKLEEQVTTMLADCEKQLNDGFQLVAKFTQHMSDWWEQPAKKIEVKKLQLH